MILPIFRLAGILLAFLLLGLFELFPFWPESVRYRVYHHACRAGCFLSGIHRKVTGQPATDRPLLLVANHVSYLDILIIWATIPDMTFVGEESINRWPLLGFFIRRATPISVRRKISKAKEDSRSVADYLKRHPRRILLFFPEARTGDGVRMRSFHSSLFRPVEEMDLSVQPVAVRYETVNGLPLATRLRRLYLWKGGMFFPAHLWRVLQSGRISVALTFLPALRVTDRKQAARVTQAAIAEALHPDKKKASHEEMP